LEESFRNLKLKCIEIASKSSNSSNIPGDSDGIEKITKQLVQNKIKYVQATKKLEKYLIPKAGTIPKPTKSFSLKKEAKRVVIERKVPFVSSVTSKPSYSVLTNLQEYQASKRQFSSKQKIEANNDDRIRKDVEKCSKLKSYERPTQSSQAKTRKVNVSVRSSNCYTSTDHLINLRLLREARLNKSR
ncbi:MAG: hypothetical protein MHPSP_000617, partial [Paramarteilia canceri]